MRHPVTRFIAVSFVLLATIIGAQAADQTAPILPSTPFVQPAGTLVTSPAATTSANPNGETASQEALYLEAMRSIADGRQSDASDVLSRMITLEPLHAGAWLDLAIIQCELGHAKEAERLFDAIVTRFAPPPAILEVITVSRKRGCTGWQPASKLSLLLGHGFDSNVNQGASSPTFIFGSGLNQIEAQLLPDYLPRHDQFTVFQSDYSRDLSTNGTVGTLQFQARVNDRASRFDATAAVATVEHPWRVASWGVRGIGTLALLTLDGRLYQTQTALQARITPKLPVTDSLQLSIVPGVTHVDYPTLTGYNANTAELRGVLSYRLPQTEFSGNAGYLADYAVANRPGGDRKGWASGVRINHRFDNGMFGDLGWSRQTWHSETAYSPGLIDTIRNQDMRIIRATLIYPLRTHQNLQLEVRTVRNQENISIFQYNSRQVQLSWQWQNF